MVELRKRKPSQVPSAPPPAKKKSNPVKAAVDKAKAVIAGEKTNGASAAASKVAVGDTIPLDGFGGDVETQDGVKTSLKQLVDESKNGVVLFTYPKASTPGCTTQACLFRDAYSHLTSTGLSIYGLSTDSPKANTTFKTKQSLPYPLLCDPSALLISAIGFKKAPKGTTRGVFVVDKRGKVVAAEPGGPQATVDVVANLIKEGKVGTAGSDNAATAEPVQPQPAASDAPVAEKEDSAALAAPTQTDGASEASTNETNDTKPVPSATPAENSAAALPESEPAEPAAPAATEPALKPDEAPLAKIPSKVDEEAAKTASEVADSAAMLDVSTTGTPAAEPAVVPAANGEKVAASA